MKKYKRSLVARILLLILLSLAIGLSFGCHIYWAVLPLIITAIWSARLLFGFFYRTVTDISRLINAIRFSEFNISFKGFEDKGLYPELVSEMEKAIIQFNKKVYDIQAEQNFYDILLNRIDAGLIVIDESKEVRWINKAALDILGKPQPRLLNDLQVVSAELPVILDKLNPSETRTIKIQNNKKEYRLLVTAVMFNIKGLSQKLITFKNIQSALDENESEAWKKLIKVLTHEMMNSIAPIISLADTFSKPDAQQGQDMVYGAMKTIHRRSKSLVEFVNNYKKLTHIPLPDYSLFEAGELINDITNLFVANGVKLTVSGIEKITINADRGQIEQVLINLIKNACEASSGRENPDVKIGISKNEYQRPVIIVSDNGYGIPEEQLDKIFIPFFSTKKEGSGIGLSICRQIISAHGGAISVVSEVNKGTQVTVRL
ncbi:MAG: ATP-binding protein [Prevotella sp.]|jgi:nitrogen fixation/metabolism regulation signal transduction histidine kinase|nr:ATP-binding protein [Prevotella sp.]